MSVITNNELNEELSKQLQPFITIATMGLVSHGKSSLIKNMTGVDPMKSKKEAEENKTLKLGYTNAKFYKCSRCPLPYCYQINSENCKYCSDSTELVLHVSFVDSPGHSDLQTTALSGASTVDYCLMLMAANHKDHKDYKDHKEEEKKGKKKNDKKEHNSSISEHYKAIKILGLNKKTIGIQNKIDLVQKSRAYEHFEEIKRKYDLRCVIPICATFGFGVEYLIQFIIEMIPYPINDKFIEKISLPLKASIIRSFDINKKGTNASEIKGAVVGGTIKQGKIKIGDHVKIIPGIITSDGKNFPLEAFVTSLKTDNTTLDSAYPGGLIGIGLSIDPSLSKEDRLVGNFIVGIDNTECRLFNCCTISYEEYDHYEFNLKVNDICMLMLGSIKRVIKIIKLNTNTKEIRLISQVNMAGEANDSVIILNKTGSIQSYGKIKEIHSV
jgi:translation initiation factor 2 subunit 3